jgi:hypothetical protein
MSDKAEELAKQLLEKTEGGKLPWHFVASTAAGEYWGEKEGYRTDLEDGSSFSITRKTNGDNKVLIFELSQPGRVVLSAQSSNFIGPKTRELLEIRRDFIRSVDEEKLAEPIDAPMVARFRLFSDLFHAARKNAVDEDLTIEKVQQLLARLS